MEVVFNSNIEDFLSDTFRTFKIVAEIETFKKESGHSEEKNTDYFLQGKTRSYILISRNKPYILTERNDWFQYMSNAENLIEESIMIGGFNLEYIKNVLNDKNFFFKPSSEELKENYILSYSGKYKEEHAGEENDVYSLGPMKIIPAYASEINTSIVMPYTFVNIKKEEFLEILEENNVLTKEEINFLLIKKEETINNNPEER